jgi:hypothetical protein
VRYLGWKKDNVPILADRQKRCFTLKAPDNRNKFSKTLDDNNILNETRRKLGSETSRHTKIVMGTLMEKNSKRF